MDELEKKVPEVEVTEVEATEVETPELEAAAGEPTEGACVAETEEAPARNVHTMSKEELVAAMKEILENDKMESHREVTAMKQAFFSLRSRTAGGTERFRGSRQRTGRLCGQARRA